jgi:hypothetical protein
MRMYSADFCEVCAMLDLDFGNAES